MAKPNRPWFRHYDAGVPREIPEPDLTLPERLRWTAERYGEREAIDFLGRGTTYGELYAAARRFARVLQDIGVRPGERVALLFPNVPQAVFCYYGAMIAGAVVVQVNPLAGAREMSAHLRDSGAVVLAALDVLLWKFMQGLSGSRLKAVLIARMAEELPAHLWAGYQFKSLIGRIRLPPAGAGEKLSRLMTRARPADHWPGQKMESLALLQYTGGTTGIPKAACLTQRNLTANVEQCRAWLGSSEEDEDVNLLAVPFFHVYGMTVGMNIAVRNAQKMVLLPRFDAWAVMKSIKRTRATIFPGVQPFYQAINEIARRRRCDISSIRICISGAGPLMREVQEEFEAMTGGKLREGYGLTEASPVTHCNPLHGARKVGYIGLPVPSTDAKILDCEDASRELPPGEIGELAVRGPQVMAGYWNNEEETGRVLRDGWLFTGDMAFADEDGFFRIVDRRKEMITSGGENIYPRDIEEALFRHPAVKDAAVIGVPDRRYGERPKAFIVLGREGSLTEAELREYCRTQLARIQVPDSIEFRHFLPRSETGKLLRRILVEQETGAGSPGISAK